MLRLSALHCSSAKEILETDFSSKSFDIHCCVPQGSCLGQISCIMYLPGIFNEVKNHPPSIHVYADDIQLYLSFKPLSTTLQHDALRAFV